jgi:hypothetical protein
MKLIYLLFLCLFIENIYATSFSDMIKNLRILESYISQYKSEGKSKKSLTNLVVSYIREGKYKDVYWKVAAGSAPKDLADYVAKKDKEHGTNSAQCRKYGDIVMPSNEKSDFVHLFAVMNGIDYCGSYTKGVSALVGWGGDTAQLIQDIKKLNGDENKLYIEATKFFRIKGQFGEGDLIADLDAPIFLAKKNDKNTFADIIEKYYNNGEYKNRVRDFVKLTFPELNKNSDKNEFRKVIYDRYSKDSYLKILEIKYAVYKGYENHRFAAVYNFADYLYKNYKK